MEMIRTVPETVMVAEYLHAEITSPRFGAEVRRALDDLGLNAALVVDPDVEDEGENAARAEVLGRCRGYGHDRDMFAGVPTDLVWREVTLSVAEVGALRYVDDGYWNELSGGSRLVRDGAASIRAGVVVFDVPNDRFLDLANQIVAGRTDLGPLIAWEATLDGPLELIEGHLRATAMAMAGDAAPAGVRGLVGGPPLTTRRRT